MKVRTAQILTGLLLLAITAIAGVFILGIWVNPHFDQAGHLGGTGAIAVLWLIFMGFGIAAMTDVIADARKRERRKETYR